MLFSLSFEALLALHDPKSLQALEAVGGLEGLATLLHTSPRDGVAGTDLDLRTAAYGANRLPARKLKLFFVLCWEALQDKVLIMLLIAAVISLALGLYETFGQDPEYDLNGKEKPKVEWVEGVAIIVAIAIVVLVGAANDFQKERQFARLSLKKDDRQVVVVRGGQEMSINIHDLAVGDLLTLQTGDVIPADAVMVQGSCECDELALTGESNTIRKVPADVAMDKYTADHLDLPAKGVHDPYLISGSKILSGLGKAVVTAVGEHSIHGRTMALLQVESEVTPMQARLNDLADGIAKFGLIAALVLFIVLFIRFCINIGPSGHDHHLTGSKKGLNFLNILITAITIIVVAVPEGLPLAVTLALAFATTRMAKDGNLVRVLRLCETMGGATAVCSDKTGTLTENRMRVVRGVVAGAAFDDASAKEVVVSVGERAAPVRTNIVLNSTAFENTDEDANEPGAEAYIGNKTETALLLYARDVVGAFALSLLAQQRAAAEKLVVQIIPFESSRKWGAVVVKHDGGFRAYLKGAAEMVLAQVASALENDAPMTDAARDAVAATINTFAEDALRTLSLVHADFAESLWPPSTLVDAANPSEADAARLFSTTPWVLDAVVGIQDPLRPGVPKAVADCQRAGVTVRMVTGDNLVTARAIALGCGILTKELAQHPQACMEGPVFRALSAEERNEAVPHIRVLARLSPEDKRVLVKTLKSQNEVVAVTGDGTNDAPALKLADVGFSMGISGTEVAREASDIILMSDDFLAIVQAIVWGRCVSTSIQKFIQFQLTVNVTAVVLTFVSAVADSEGASVLTAVQLLWVNLIMDTLAALALATDKPDATLLDRKPAGRHAPLILVSMWKMIMLQATVQLIITLTLHFAGPRIFHGKAEVSGHDKQQLHALTFNTFVWLQFFKIIVARKLDEADGIETVRGRMTAFNLNFFQHLFRNWYFIVIIAIIGGGQVLIMFVGGAAFSIVRQTGPQWAVAIVAGLLSLPAGVIVRCVPDSWVIKVFPTRAFKAVVHVVSFRWLRKSKKDPETGDVEDATSPLYRIPAFRRARQDILNIKAQQKLRGWKGDWWDTDSLHTEETYKPGVSALAMVSGVVGGAVAGWQVHTDSDSE